MASKLAPAKAELRGNRIQLPQGHEKNRVLALRFSLDACQGEQERSRRGLCQREGEFVGRQDIFWLLLMRYEKFHQRAHSVRQINRYRELARNLSSLQIRSY